MLRLTWLFSASPGAARVFQNPGMSGTLGNTQVTFNAWRRDNGKTYTSASSTASDGSSRAYCAGRMSVAVNKTAHTVTMRVPISCLPAGKVFTNPYPTSAVVVLKSGSELVEGYLASDSSIGAPAFAIRR